MHSHSSLKTFGQNTKSYTYLLQNLNIQFSANVGACIFYFIFFSTHEALNGHVLEYLCEHCYVAMNLSADLDLKVLTFYSAPELWQPQQGHLFQIKLRNTLPNNIRDNLGWNPCLVPIGIYYYQMKSMEYRVVVNWDAGAVVALLFTFTQVY